MGIFGKSKKEREKEYMNKLDVKSCLKENFELIIDEDRKSTRLNSSHAT